jgi:hypothetical protein
VTVYVAASGQHPPAPAGDFDPAAKVSQGQFGLETTEFLTFSPVTVVTLQRLCL